MEVVMDDIYKYAACSVGIRTILHPLDTSVMNFATSGKFYPHNIKDLYRGISMSVFAGIIKLNSSILIERRFGDIIFKNIKSTYTAGFITDFFAGSVQVLINPLYIIKQDLQTDRKSTFKIILNKRLFSSYWVGVKNVFLRNQSSYIVKLTMLRYLYNSDDKLFQKIGKGLIAGPIGTFFAWPFEYARIQNTIKSDKTKNTEIWKNIGFKNMYFKRGFIPAAMRQSISSAISAPVLLKIIEYQKMK